MNRWRITVALWVGLSWGAAAQAQECPTGQSISADTAGHCCWFEQAWSSTRGECVGAPRCLDGWRVEGSACVEVTAPPAQAVSVTPVVPVTTTVAPRLTSLIPPGGPVIESGERGGSALQFGSAQARSRAVARSASHHLSLHSGLLYDGIGFGAGLSLWFCPQLVRRPDDAVQVTPLIAAGWYIRAHEESAVSTVPLSAGVSVWVPLGSHGVLMSRAAFSYFLSIAKVSGDERVYQSYAGTLGVFGGIRMSSGAVLLGIDTHWGFGSAMVASFGYST